MTDELDWAREVGEAATDGAYRYDADGGYIWAGDGHMVAQVRGYGAEVSGNRPQGSQDANGESLALWGSTHREALAVIEAVDAYSVTPALDPRHPVEAALLAGALEPARVARVRIWDALARYRAAVRRFRESQDGGTDE